MTFLSLINRALPFATPGTPLVQDLIHLAAICLLLYYAPQIQQRIQSQRGTTGGPHAEEELPDPQNLPFNDEADDQAGGTDEDALAGERGDAAAELNDLEAAPPQNDMMEEGHAGPAHAAAPGGSRNVGAKKAKSLARKDQRRAYHEFMRSQGEAQRARDAEGAAEREKILAAEREKRKAAEAVLEAKKRREREEDRRRVEEQRKREMQRRDLAVDLVKRDLEDRKLCDLFEVARQVSGDADQEWVEKILLASGMIGKKGDIVTMITGTGWAVRVSADDMTRVYETAVAAGMGDENGKIEYAELIEVLEAHLRA